MTHVSCKIIFTTGARHEGLSGQFSVFLCLLLNTLWGSYPLQLANAVPPLPSTAIASPCLPPLPLTHSLPSVQLSSMLHSSCTFCLIPQLPHSRCTFATCARADTAAACLQFRDMSTTPMSMPLRTSPDAPYFCGDANDLPHYLTEVEDLCQSRQWMTGPERIKYAVYYTDESSWNIWDSAREVLADPASWEDFKSAMQDLYPRYKVVHAPMPLPASLLPPAAVPCILPPFPPPAAAVLLALDAIQALLSAGAPSMRPSEVPAKPLLQSVFTSQVPLPALPPATPIAESQPVPCALPKTPVGSLPHAA